MSGQQPQQFRTTPGFQAPEASAAATTRTQGFQATAAVVESDARGLTANISFSTINTGDLRKVTDETGTSWYDSGGVLRARMGAL